MSGSAKESTLTPILIKRISISLAESPELPKPHTRTRSALLKYPVIFPICLSSTRLYALFKSS